MNYQFEVVERMVKPKELKPGDKVTIRGTFAGRHDGVVATVIDYDEHPYLVKIKLPDGSETQYFRWYLYSHPSN